MIVRSRAIPLFLLLLASACAGGPGGYPSLGKRAAEVTPSIVSQAPISAPESASAEPELKSRLAELTGMAERARAAFDARYDDVARQVRAAGAAPVSSESWVAAHVALGKLEETRYGSDFALASLDTLYGERADAVALGKASGGLAEIAAARDAVSAIVAGQNGRMEALRGILVSP